MSAKKTEETLLQANISPCSLHGIFITHEHTDHVSGLRVFTQRYRMPIYATAGTASELIAHGNLPANADLRVLDSSPVEIGGFSVTPFPTSHDSKESCGFTISFPDGRSAALCTDTGYISDTVMQALVGKDLVMIESNHDVRMLQNSTYPYALKQRILSDTGHLSNDACSKILPELVRKGTTRIALGHLSKENNHPQLAHVSAISALNAESMRENYDFTLMVAPRVNEAKKAILF